jgi:hypothetical protein
MLLRGWIEPRGELVLALERKVARDGKTFGAKKAALDRGGVGQGLWDFRRDVAVGGAGFGDPFEGEGGGEVAGVARGGGFAGEGLGFG